MQNVITAHELSEKINLLDDSEKQTVYDFVMTLLRRGHGKGAAKKKDLLLKTSVWSEQDVQGITSAQQDVNAWRIPT